VIFVGYALAIVIGISLGLLGGGGAILTVPVLVYVLGVGMKQAVPMSLVVVGATSLTGVVHHSREGNVDWRSILSFGPAAILGSLLGAAVALRVSGHLQLIIFGVVLILAAVMMLRGPAGAEAGRRAHPGVLALIGAAVGTLTGLIGVGGGFLYVPALALLGGLEMRRAVGTSLGLIAISCAAGLLGYLGRMPIDWQVVLIFGLLAFVGVRIGAALVPRVSQQALRKGFAALLLVIGVVVLITGE
jgi:uncharacterized membrane protein YfcA